MMPISTFSTLIMNCNRSLDRRYTFINHKTLTNDMLSIISLYLTDLIYTMLLYLAGGHVFSPTEYAALTTAVLFLTIPRPQATQKGSPCRVTFENSLLYLIIIILYNRSSNCFKRVITDRA